MWASNGLWALVAKSVSIAIQSLKEGLAKDSELDKAIKRGIDFYSRRTRLEVVMRSLAFCNFFSPPKSIPLFGRFMRPIS